MRLSLLPLAALALAAPAAAQTLADLNLGASGVVQTDARYYPADPDDRGTDGFLMRRVRIEFEATLGPVSAVIEPDLAEGETLLNDGWVAVDLGRGLAVRAGRMKTPIGLESLRSATSLRFGERALPTNLVPRRDLGVMAEGAWADDRVEAQLGVFNGVVGGADEEGQNGSDAQDVAARVFVRPPGVLDGLGLGVAVALGAERGEPGDPRTPVVEAAGERLAFDVREGAFADGARQRLGLEADFLRGPVSLLGEWNLARQVAEAPGGETADIDRSAWQLAAVVSVTGEPQARGLVRPRRPLGTPGGIGALELGLRADALRVSDDAFGAVADPATQAARVFGWAASALWTPVDLLRLSVTFNRTAFRTVGDAPLPAESFVVARAQVVF